MILHAAESLVHAVDEVVCVIRSDDHALQYVCEAEGLTVMHCPDAHLGMSTSLKASILARPNAQGCLIALGDMPLIQTTTCQQVANTFQEQNKIVIPSYQGKRGHPVAFSNQYREALLTLTEDRRAKPVLQQYANDVVELLVEDAGVCWDVDTQESLQLLLDLSLS